jgi:hypothetical protein
MQYILFNITCKYLKYTVYQPDILQHHFHGNTSIKQAVKNVSLGLESI